MLRRVCSYGPVMPSVQVLPTDLLAAAAPLRAASAALRDVADQRRRLLGLADALPHPLVRAAVADFVTSAELAVWELSETLRWLSNHLVQAQEWYRSTEDAIARRIPVLTPRTDYPALLPPAAVTLSPAPQPGSAPVPP